MGGLPLALVSMAGYVGCNKKPEELLKHCQYLCESTKDRREGFNQEEEPTKDHREGLNQEEACRIIS